MLSPSAGGPAPRIAYGPGPHQFGELRAAHGRSRGVVMIVHGGFWRAQRSLDVTAPAADALAAAGFDTWNVEYRRGGQGGWSDTLADVASAFDHLGVLAGRGGLGLDRVLLLGHSAGGHLAAWCAGRAAEATRGGTAPPPVPAHGLVAAGAMLDLVAGALDGTGEHAVAEFLGGMPDQVPGRYAAADPAQRTPIGIPARCVHSTADQRVPHAQSVRYVEAARSAGDDVELIDGSGAHADVITVGHPDFRLVTAALDELAA
jgi:acetyl esterase/lipase